MNKKQNYTDRPPRKFLAFAGMEVEKAQSQGKYSTAGNYITAASRFRQFLLSRQLKDVTFRQTDALLILDFESWLHQQGLCRNSCSAYLRTLQTVWSRAVRMGVAPGGVSPFEHTYRGISRTRKRAVTPDDICRLRQLDIAACLQSEVRARVPVDGKRFQEHLQRLLQSRDFFLFSFCCRGMPFVDMAYLQRTSIVDGVISYARRKTGQRLQIHIEPAIQTIIDRYACDSSPYVFPILTEATDERLMHRQYTQALHRYDRTLHELGRMLGGLPLTSYVSRHTWASTAYERHVPLSIICQGMGHNNERTTEIYLKSIDNAQVDRANREMLNDLFGDPLKESL